MAVSRFFGIDAKRSEAGNGDSELATMRRCVGLLLEGFRTQMRDGEPEVVASFNATMRRLDRQFESSKTNASRLAVIGEVVTTLEERMRGEERAATVRAEEDRKLRRVLLTRLALALEPQNAYIAEQLRALEPVFDAAASADSFREAREQLELALAARAPAESLVKAGRSWSEAEVDAETGDSPTGLRGRASGRQALRDFCRIQRRFQLCVFRLDGLDMIGARYGEEAEQDCLLSTSSYLQQSLKAEDRLYHWDRRALLAILDREGSEESLQGEMMRLCGLRPQQSLQMGDRLVMAAMTIVPHPIVVPHGSGYDDVLALVRPFSPDGVKS